MKRVLALLLLCGTACAASVADSPPVAAARAHLLDHLHRIRPDVEHFELALTGRPPAVAGAVAPAKSTGEAIHGNVLSPHTCVWVEGARSVGSVPVWFSVKAYRKVLVSQRNHAARDLVDTGDFTVEELDVAPLGNVPIAVDTDMARMRTRHLISAGRVVLKDDLEEIPQVLRGQEVTVEVKHGAVEIETSAVALREARLGEAVTLQNPTSHMTYGARVVGQGRVAVIQ
jgi:flagella basal body P-ring formation protein FlgA